MYVFLFFYFFFFFFKQKTAYEMRISDWSSDVCSSDLDDPFMTPEIVPSEEELSKDVTLELSEKGGHVGFISGHLPGKPVYWLEQRIPDYLKQVFEIGRASCRESVCQYV